MNVQQTTGASAALEIRELTATELDEVSGGCWWVWNTIDTCWMLALTSTKIW